MFKLYCCVPKRYNISRKLQGHNERVVFTFSDLECTHSLTPGNITHQKEKRLEICKVFVRYFSKICFDIKVFTFVTNYVEMYAPTGV